MYPGQNHIFLEEERRKDALRAAEKHRLIKLALSGKPGTLRLGYHRLMSRMGALLVSVGSRLQTPYEELRATRLEAQISTEQVTPCS